MNAHVKILRTHLLQLEDLRVSERNLRSRVRSLTNEVNVLKRLYNLFINMFRICLLKVSWKSTTTSACYFRGRPVTRTTSNSRPTSRDSHPRTTQSNRATSRENSLSRTSGRLSRSGSLNRNNTRSSMPTTSLDLTKLT